MINVSELTGAQLDTWVVRAHGVDVPRQAAEYSTDWALAGPIIERERIEIIPSVADDGQWSAWAYQRGPFYFGATPLIAAMRAFVASRFGPIVPPPAVERRQVERCAAYQASDQMLCKCGLAWDVNDPDPPTCGRATARDRRR